MQIGNRLVRNPAELLSERGAFAQDGDQPFGPCQQLLKARRRPVLMSSRFGHCDSLPMSRPPVYSNRRSSAITYAHAGCALISGHNKLQDEKRGDRSETWLGDCVAGFGERHPGERRVGARAGRRADRHSDLQCVRWLGFCLRLLESAALHFCTCRRRARALWRLDQQILASTSATRKAVCCFGECSRRAPISRRGDCREITSAPPEVRRSGSAPAPMCWLAAP